MNQLLCFYRQLWYNVDESLSTHYGTTMAKKIHIELKEVRKLAAMQCSEAEVAAFFGIGVRKFKEIVLNFPEVKKAWEQGRELGKTSLRRKQFRLADNNATMAIHLGKQYLNQTEHSSIEINDKSSGDEFDLTKLDQNERDQLRKVLTRAQRPEATA